MSGNCTGLIRIELNGTWGLCFKHVIGLGQMWAHFLKNRWRVYTAIDTFVGKLFYLA